MIFGDALKAIGQMGDPVFRGVLIRGIGLTILLLGTIIWGLSSLLGGLIPDQIDLPLIGPIAWFDNLAVGGTVFIMLFVSIFLMVPVASLFTSLFLDRVAEAVERRHYPHLPEARSLSWAEAMADSVKFLFVIIGANLCATFLYILFAPAAPLMFLGLNGYLLGREYFQLAAVRHMPLEDAKAFRRRYAGEAWAAGALMAVPLSIPIVNLLVPVLGAATFTHLVQRLAGRA